MPGLWRAFEREWGVLVTYRPAAARHQARVWADRKAKVLEKVAQGRKRRMRSEKAVWRRLSQLIPDTYPTCFRMAVEKVDRGFVPKVEVLVEAERKLEASFGKTAIITDLPEAKHSAEELVEGFVARSEIEDDWRWLKDRHVMSVKPVWVWSEVSVPGHVFLCVLGLLLVRYLQWELRAEGLTIKQLMAALDGIKAVLVRAPEGRPRLVLERMDGLSAEVFTKLRSGRYLPRWQAPAPAP